MKITLNAEYRFNIFGSLNGALFVDAGNIWNVLDNVTDPKAVFSGLSSLKNMAVGTGLGARYDLEIFVVRLDLGFKTYDPALESGQKWFTRFGFKDSVFNFGIN
jgi:outer membrane protein assembly factor BamA